MAGRPERRPAAPLSPYPKGVLGTNTGLARWLVPKTPLGYGERGARLPLSRRILRASWAPTTVRGRCWPGWRKTRHPAARGLWHRVCTLPGSTEEHEHQTWRQARRDGAPLPLPVAHVRALAQQPAASGPGDGVVRGEKP